MWRAGVLAVCRPDARFRLDLLLEPVSEVTVAWPKQKTLLRQAVWKESGNAVALFRLCENTQKHTQRTHLNIRTHTKSSHLHSPVRAPQPHQEE